MIPSSTYRLQLGPEMTFDQVAEIADYLAALGVGAVYAQNSVAALPASSNDGRRQAWPASTTTRT